MSALFLTTFTPSFSFLTLVSLLGVVALLGYWVLTHREISAPNQWLLRIRNGKPITAGIGIQFWRWPGDTVARFTSTMQRVTFETEIYTLDKQKILVKGFILWGISPEGDAPFRAFSRLGIAHKAQDTALHPEAHHALSRPQHHAFRRSVEASLRTSAVLFPLRDVLSSPAQLSHHTQQQLAEVTDSWGILIEATEITDLEVVQRELFEHLQAPYIEQSRLEAEKLQLGAQKEVEELRMEQNTQLSFQRAENSRQQELQLARLELEKEAEKARLFEEQLELQQRRLEQETALAKMRDQKEHQRAIESIERSEQVRLREEQVKVHLLEARQIREDKELQASLSRLALERKAELEYLAQKIELESQKSDAVREAELSKELVQRAAEAIQQLPIHDIRWFSSGQEQGPSGLLLGIIDALQQVRESAHSTSSLET